MEQYEYIINHNGKHYVGTLSDYRNLCVRRFDPYEKVYLRTATADELIEYNKRFTRLEGV